MIVRLVNESTGYKDHFLLFLKPWIILLYVTNTLPKNIWINNKCLAF